MSDDIIEDYENKDCEIFVKECRITQCFNCQQYDHIDKACRNQTRCDHCVDFHISWDCTVKTSVRHKRCAVCQHKKHETWTSKCDARRYQMRRAQHVYKTRLRFFAIEIKTTMKSQMKVEWTSILSRRQKTSTIQRESISTSRIQKRTINNDEASKDSQSLADVDILMTKKKSVWALTIMNSERRERVFVKSKKNRSTKKLVVVNKQADSIL